MSDIKIGDWVYSISNYDFYFCVKAIERGAYWDHEEKGIGCYLPIELAVKLKTLTISKLKKLVRGNKLICTTNNLKKTCGVVSGQIVYFRGYGVTRIIFAKNEQDRSIDEYVADIQNFVIHPDTREESEEGELLYLISKKDFEKLMEKMNKDVIYVVNKSLIEIKN